MSSIPTAGLSLDLDNLWSYMRIHGEAGWDRFPTYLDVVVPRILEFADAIDVSMTVFVVGKDATLEENRPALKSIVDAGHEIGNHSFLHEPWLHRYSREELARELGAAHEAILSATGVVPRGFRGPGFSITTDGLGVLRDLGYGYDSSLLPTFVGPMARWYYFRGTDLSEEETEEREALFGSFSDGRHPNRPFVWELDGGEMPEFPVTTFPGLKVPFHFSYVLYLSDISERIAAAYFRAGIASAARFGFGPTMLLHPLDFLDESDAPELAFFPAMAIPAAVKVRRLEAYVDIVSSRFEVVPMGAHVLRTPHPLRRPAPGERRGVTNR